MDGLLIYRNVRVCCTHIGVFTRENLIGNSDYDGRRQRKNVFALQFYIQTKATSHSVPHSIEYLYIYFCVKTKTIYCFALLLPYTLDCIRISKILFPSLFLSLSCPEKLNQNRRQNTVPTKKCGLCDGTKLDQFDLEKKMYFLGSFSRAFAYIMKTK